MDIIEQIKGVVGVLHLMLLIKVKCLIRSNVSINYLLVPKCRSVIMRSFILRFTVDNLLVGNKSKVFVSSTRRKIKLSTA